MTTRRRRKSTIRGELREWREVGLRETSYFAGAIYGDNTGQYRDGHSFTTGFVIIKVDRGDYWLLKTAGNHAYMLYKDKEFKG